MRKRSILLGSASRVSAAILAGSAALHLAAPARAADVTLQGSYLLLSVNEIGTPGLGAPTPTQNPALNFDPAGTGSFTLPDFITGGTPLAGFSFESTGAGILRNENANALTPSFLTTLPTTNTSAGGNFSATWAGAYDIGGVGGNDVAVSLAYSFAGSDRIIKVTATVTAITPQTAAKFAVFLDPDQDSAPALPGGTFNTNNIRGGIAGVTQIVTATGPISGRTIGLYADAGFPQNTGIAGAGFGNFDPDLYLSGTDDGNGDKIIGLGFDLGNLGAAQSVTFEYYYIFSGSLAGLVLPSSTQPFPDSANTNANTAYVGMAIAKFTMGHLMKLIADPFSPFGSVGGEEGAAYDVSMGVDALSFAPVASDGFPEMRMAPTAAAGNPTGLSQDTQVWVRPMFGWQKTEGADGYDGTMGGVLAGLNLRVDQTLSLGVAGGYANGSYSENGNDGNSNSDSYSGWLYGNWRPVDELTFSGLAGYIWTDSSADRENGDIRADLDFPAYGGDLRATYRLDLVRQFALAPYAELAAARAAVDSFDESGTGNTLDFNGDGDTSVWSTVGIGAQFTVPLSETGAMRLQADVGWQHDYDRSSFQFDVASGDAARSVTVDQDAIALGLGSEIDIGDAVSIGAWYDGELRNDAQTHVTGLTGRLHF